MIFLITTYFFLSFVAIFFEKHYIYYFLIFNYFLILTFRLIYPYFFGFRVVEPISFLMIVLLISCFIRLFPLGVFLIALNMPSFLRKPSFIKKLGDIFLNFVEKKDMFFRRLFSRNTWFLFFYYGRLVFNRINRFFLILFFFFPSTLFIYFLYTESVLENYSITVYLFSLKLLFNRLYPKLIYFVLGWGNLYYLYLETTDDFNQPKNLFLNFTSNFFSEVCAVYKTFVNISRLSLTVALFGDNQVKGRHFLEKTQEHYFLYFFPCRNWMILCQELGVLKKRLISLDILLVLTLFLAKFLVIDLLLLFLISLIFWIWHNCRLIKKLFNFKVSEKKFLENILPYFNRIVITLNLNFFVIDKNAFINNNNIFNAQSHLSDSSTDSKLNKKK